MSVLEAADPRHELLPGEPGLLLLLQRWQQDAFLVLISSHGALDPTVQFFMQEAGISTLQDLDEFVGKQQESLIQLDGVGKAIRKKQTALKHLETFQRLKSISDKSKRGMGFVRKKHAEKHQQELNDFAKAVRYMNANRIKAAD